MKGLFSKFHSNLYFFVIIFDKLSIFSNFAISQRNILNYRESTEISKNGSQISNNFQLTTIIFRVDTLVGFNLYTQINKEESKLKKLITLFLLLAIIAGSIFAAGNKEEAADQPVKLRIAWWGSQTRHDRTLKVLDLFTEQTGIEFEAEYMPFDGYFTKLNTLIASGDEYDIIQLGGNFPTYKDNLLHLNSYIEDGTIDVTNISDANLKTTALDGVQYGMSLGINTYGIAYDPALFKAAGVSEPTSDWTWDEYEAACMTIHNKLGIFGSSKMEDFFAACTMGVPQHDINQSFFKEDGSGLNYTDDSPISNYFAMKQRLVNAGAYPDPGQINEIKDIEGDYLVTGEAAMTWVASNQFNAIVNASGRNLKIATMPRYQKDKSVGVAMQSSQLFAVSKNSAHKKEAVEFLNFVVNSTDANNVLLGERGIPISSVVRESVKQQLDATQIQVYDFIDLMSEISDTPVILDPVQQPEIRDLFSRLHDQVVTNKISPVDAAATLHSEAEKIFSR